MVLKRERGSKKCYFYEEGGDVTRACRLAYSLGGFADFAGGRKKVWVMPLLRWWGLISEGLGRDGEKALLAKEPLSRVFRKKISVWDAACSGGFKSERRQTK